MSKARAVAAASFLLFAGIFSPLEGQTCPAGAIKNLRIVNSPAGTFGLAWDRVSLSNVSYQVMGASSSAYCTLRSQPVSVVGQTTQTTFNAPLSTGERAYEFFVRVTECPAIVSDQNALTDTFRLPPPKPSLAAAQSGPGQVTLTFSRESDRNPFVSIERAAGTGSFLFVGDISIVDQGFCGGRSVSFVDYGPGGSATAGGRLPAGLYRYRVSTRAFGNDITVISDVVTVTIASICIPPAVAPVLSAPSSPIAGSHLTLSWTDSETVDVFLLETSGDPTFSSVRPVRIPGELRSANLIFEVPGSRHLRLTAITRCGSLRGNPIVINVQTAPANIVMTSAPTAMVQAANSAGAATSYTLTNLGGTASQITVTQSGGTFFTQSPTSFTLQSGASQIVQITALPVGLGEYNGTSMPAGSGILSTRGIPIRLFVGPRPEGSAVAKAAENRVDVSGGPGANPTGNVRFRNDGNATLTGIAQADVDWISPPSGPIVIPPGQTVQVPFSIIRSERADANAPTGSATGRIALVYRKGTADPAKAIVPFQAGPASAATPVTVVDTVKPTTSASSIPPLAADEVAVFIPGVGHVQGSVGLFLSDVALYTLNGDTGLKNVDFYFTARGTAAASSAKTTIDQLLPNLPLSIADVVKNVFNNEAALGTLQLRSTDIDRLGISASVFVSSDPAGTFGTVIPAFRSDRAVTTTEKLFLTGLRQETGVSHTNLYLQETTGNPTTVDIDFLSAGGAIISQHSETLQGFQMTFVDSARVPAGAVSALLGRATSSVGNFVAFATPVDDQSRDFWSVADWPKNLAYAPSEASLIPVAGSVRGANDSFFRTDVAILNNGTSSGSGVLKFYSRNGETFEQTITLGGLQTRIINDVTTTLFGAPDGSVGYLVFTPGSGSFTVTSRTYATVSGKSGTFGTGVPTVPANSGIRRDGNIQRMGGLEDAALSSITAATPGTFRTNLGLIETSGQTATVRATMRYSISRGTVTAKAIGTKEWVLQPRQFLLLQNIGSEILGPSRNTNFGDLHNVQVDFEVVDGDGSVVVFTSSTDNGTNDTLLRTE